MKWLQLDRRSNVRHVLVGHYYMADEIASTKVSDNRQVFDSFLWLFFGKSLALVVTYLENSFKRTEQ
jgi:hypothetical protein